MTRDDYILLDDDDLAKQCRLDTFRGSGPGGQHRNVTDSAVRLTLEANPEITVTCCEGRSQHDNRKLAVRRLRLTLATDWRLPELTALDGKLPARRDPAYALHLARLLDALALHGAQVGDAAKALGLSTGQYIKQLALDDAIWATAIQLRQAAGLKALKRN